MAKQHMKYTKVYIKQAKTHVAGHVFEHVVANFIQKHLLDSGYLKLLDYRFWAYTDDGIVQIQFETQHQAVLAEFEKSIELVKVSEESVRVALKQISCEQEKLPNFKVSGLLKEVKEVANVAWVDYDNYNHSAPIQDQAKTLKSKSGEFGRKSPKSFQEYLVIYEIENCPFELKPLAVYVILGLALNQIIKLYSDLEDCYDSSDEWAEYQELVGYAHHLRVPKDSQIALPALQKLELTNRKEILAKNFTKKLSDYIKQQALLDNHYLTLSEMYACSYQYIGKAGWGEINTPVNIAKIINLLKIRVEKDS